MRNGYMYNVTSGKDGMSTDDVNKADKWVDDRVRSGTDPHTIIIEYGNGEIETGYQFLGLYMD